MSAQSHELSAESPAEIPLEGLTGHPNRATPLVSGSEVLGVFTNPTLAAETQRFLKQFPRPEAGR